MVYFYFRTVYIFFSFILCIFNLFLFLFLHYLPRFACIYKITPKHLSRAYYDVCGENGLLVWIFNSLSVILVFQYLLNPEITNIWQIHESWEQLLSISISISIRVQLECIYSLVPTLFFTTYKSYCKII